MNTVPNQEVATINKAQCDKQNIYAMINIEAISMAMKDLTPAQFEVWLYFAKNQAGYTFAVSPAAALQEFGIKKDTFQKAKQILKEKGYLVPDTEKGSNYWIFREIPEDKIEYITKVDVASTRQNFIFWLPTYLYENII